MKKQSVSASDVAKMAGVSRTTVSFILNNIQGKHISEATRQRVLQAVEALKYVPDIHAISLAKKTNCSVGFFISYSSSMFSDAYLFRLVEGMALVLNKRHCRLDFRPLRKAKVNYLDLVRSTGIDGVILMNTYTDDPGMQELAAAGVPLVVIGSIEGLSVPQVDIDNIVAAREMVKYLVALGHRKIAMIAHAPLAFYAAAHRLEAYRQVLAEKGIPQNPEYIEVADFSEESGYRAMQKLLGLGDRPTAVFAGNDMVAYGAIQAVLDAGLSIPEDISIAGFDDDYLSRYLNPALTTVAQPSVGLGEAAARLLLQEIKSHRESGPRGKEHIILPTILAKRESCRRI
jgi:LacI family transcriptional regulator